MDSNRKTLNEVRRELDAVVPIHCVDPLPPQPSILPVNNLPEPILVRVARKVDNKVRPSHIKHYVGNVRPRNIKQRLANRPRSRVKQFSFMTPKKVKASIVIPVYNKFDLTMQCLRSIYDRVPTSYDYEVIVVDNASSDAMPALAEMAGLKYLRNDTNLGFVDGCNFGAKSARGEYLIFLNNDAMVTEGWMENFITTMENYPAAGIVGSKIIYPDGRLQEAGGIIYKDGTGNNYGKNDHPDRYQYNYLREVDYCSGASIIIRRSIFEKLKGFDTLYRPAYYEDTDLAFRVRQLGLKVYYQPLSVIYHIEGATAGSDMSSGFKKYQAINHEKFMDRWGKQLKKEQYAHDDTYLGRDRSHNKLFLIVDEHVPTPDKDSGSVRMIAIIKLLQELGYKVTFFPNYTKHQGDYTEDLEQLGVEMVYGDVRFDDFIRDYGKYYDSVLLSRPRIGSYYLDLCQVFCPKAKIIYDTVDLHYLRLGRQATYETGEMQSYYSKMAKKHEVLEHYLISESDKAIVVSEEEARILRDRGHSNVSIISNIHSINQLAYAVAFKNRKDLIFVGGYQHLPNIDAVKWFVDEIFPLVLKQNEQIKLHVVGSAMPKSLQEYLIRPNIIIDGFISNQELHKLLTECRVFIAPMRYGAGVKGKIGQAIEYGLPIVTTDIGAEGMFLKDSNSCLTANDPKVFADKITTLYRDEKLWLKLQQGAKTVLEDHFSVDQARKDVKKVLE